MTKGKTAVSKKGKERNRPLQGGGGRGGEGRGWGRGGVGEARQPAVKAARGPGGYTWPGL